MQKKCALFSEAWTSAGGGGLAAILGDGWSGERRLGDLGVGASHTLNLHMDTLPCGDIRFDAHVGAALVGLRQSQAVDVIANGITLATWQFSAGNNNALRTARIPAAVISRGVDTHATVHLEFRPHDITPVNLLDANRRDSRSLGLALIRIRRGLI